MPERVPTIIVGAGISGLMCARTLTRAGVDVVLLERESEVGGRVRTTVRGGFRIDHGFQVLFDAYPALTAALDLPALQLRPFQPAARIALAGQPTATIGDALADASLLWPTMIAPQLSMFDKVRMLRLRQLAMSLAFEDCFAPRFDSVSTRVFLQRRGFSSRAIGNFFAPFYGGILLDRSLDTSASVLLYTFKMLAEGRTVVPADGMGAIPRQLAAALPPGTVRCGTGVTRLLRNDRGLCGVTLHDGSTVEAARVVLACDPPGIASLASTAQVHVAVPEASLGCSTVYLRSTTPLLHGAALWLNASPNATVSHAITLSNVAPSYAPRDESLTAATVLGAPASLDDVELERRVRADLTAMSGGVNSPAAELLAIWRVPYSQYAQPPGSTERRTAPVTSERGLFVASEAAHSSSLEGAARGGIAAAEAVIRSAAVG